MRRNRRKMVHHAGPLRAYELTLHSKMKARLMQCFESSCVGDQDMAGYKRAPFETLRIFVQLTSCSPMSSSPRRLAWIDDDFPMLAASKELFLQVADFFALSQIRLVHLHHCTHNEQSLDYFVFGRMWLSDHRTWRGTASIRRRVLIDTAVFAHSRCSLSFAGSLICYSRELMLHNRTEALFVQCFESSVPFTCG